MTQWWTLTNDAFMTLNCHVVFTGGKDLQQHAACSVYDWNGRNNEPWT